MVELKDPQQQKTEQAVISLIPDTDGMCAHIFESLQLEGLYVRDMRIIGGLLDQFIFFLMPSCPSLHEKSLSSLQSLSKFYSISNISSDTGFCL